MPRYGLFINYDFCVGCHACEVACKTENNRPAEEWGIRVREVEPETTGGKQYFFPFPTDKCNLCGKRTVKGKDPACVHNCWAGIMKFGTVEELAREMEKKPRSVIWAPH